MPAEVLGVTADPVKARHATVPGVDRFLDRVAEEITVLTVDAATVLWTVWEVDRYLGAACSVVGEGQGGA